MLGNKNVVNFIFFFRKCAMNPDREIVPEVRPEAEPTEPDANLQKSNKGLILDGNVMIEEKGSEQPHRDAAGPGVPHGPGPQPGDQVAIQDEPLHHPQAGESGPG